MRARPYHFIPRRRIGLGDITGGWTTSADLTTSIGDNNTVTVAPSSSDVAALYGNVGYTGSSAGTASGGYPTAFNQPQSIPNTQNGLPNFSSMINSLFGSGNTRVPTPGTASNPLGTVMATSQANTAINNAMPLLLFGLAAIVLLKKKG